MMARIKRETVRYQARNYEEPKEKPLGFAIHSELLAAIRQDALKFNVSVSFVINTAIAAIMGIDVGEKYYVPKNGMIKNGRKK